MNIKNRKWKQIVGIYILIFLIIPCFLVSSSSANSGIRISFEEKAHITSSQDIFLGCEVINDSLFAMSLSNGLKTYNISDIENPLFMDSANEVCYSHHFDIHNNLYFLADAGFGMKIFNITNPSNIIKIGQYFPEGDGEITGVHATDNLVIANEWHDSSQIFKLLIINISDPCNPIKISDYNDGESFFIRFQVENNLCYATCYDNGLKVFNISNPENIHEIAHYNEFTQAFNFKKIDDKIFITDANHFKMLNVSDLTNIFTIGEYTTIEAVFDIGINDSIVFFSEDVTGITALDISYPNDPQQIGQFNTEDIFSFYLDDHYLYLALVDFGIKIVEYNVAMIDNSIAFLGFFEFYNIFGIVALSIIIYRLSKKK